MLSYQLVDSRIVEERTVGPSLGSDSVQAGFYASIIGLVGVLIFMVISYGLFGMFAVLALLANLLMILGTLSFLGATLTLPGIAGIVLTMGMAVDSNVLVFERIREEVANGRSPLNAIETGQPYVFNGNVHNRHGGLISNLPGDCCVEVPCVADRAGIRPTVVGELPAQCAAMMRTNINVQDLVVRAVPGR